MRMLRSASLLAVLLAATPAHAQKVVVSAERLFGVTVTTQSAGKNITTVSLLGGSGAEALFTPYSVPRLGFDFIVGDAVSLGFALEFASISPDGGSSTTVFGANPRIGYVLTLSDQVKFWPRAGISYIEMSGGSTSVDYLAASFEGQFLFTPVEHVGILVGPTADVGLSGYHDNKVSQYGVQAGIALTF